MSDNVFWNQYDHINLLIADDDEFNRLLIKMYLQKIPNIVLFEADNGEDTISIIYNNTIHVCLLDLHMPTLSGYEVMQLLKDDDHDTSIIVITTDTAERHKSLHYGAADFLPKPFDLELLHEKIKKAMQGKQATPDQEPSPRQIPALRRSTFEEIEIEKSQIEFFYQLALLTHKPNSINWLQVHTVSTLAKYFVELMGAKRRTARNIYFASMVRNVGLVNFTKRFDYHSVFSEKDKQEFADSITAAYPLLSNSIETPFIRMAQKVTLQYREAYDGSGHPDGLSGEDISQEAMIVKISETFNALLCDRPYRDPRQYNHKETYHILQRKSGQEFEPKLVDFFLAHYREFYELRQKAIREFAIKHKLNIKGVA